MTLIIIGADEVRELLPMAECIGHMAEAMIAVSAGSATVPPRVGMSLGESGDALLVMPGASRDPAVFGAKLISLFDANPAHNRPVVQGLITLFDRTTGAPVAIVEGSSITAIRTAAASGLASDRLARRDARSCGILGCGVQAASHIDAIAAVRSLDQVLVWGRDNMRAQAFARQERQRTGLDVRAVPDPARAAACDIVCTVTAAQQPILRSSWVLPGTHVNLVGAHAITAREAETALIVRARPYVDLLASAQRESGDLMIPVQEGAVSEDHIVGEIGQLLVGQIEGRVNNTQITLYKSLGITAQDLYAASAVYQAALAAGTGTRVAFP